VILLGLSSVISEVFLTISVVIIASIIVSSFTTELISLQDFQRQQIGNYKEKIETKIKIIHVYTKLGSSKVVVWVKNIGLRQIAFSLIKDMDVIFISKNDYIRIKYGNIEPPNWDFIFENDWDRDNKWDPTETIRITIILPFNLTEGDYNLKIFTYTGSGDDYTFSL